MVKMLGEPGLQHWPKNTLSFHLNFGYTIEVPKMTVL